MKCPMCNMDPSCLKPESLKGEWCGAKDCPYGKFATDTYRKLLNCSGEMTPVTAGGCVYPFDDSDDNLEFKKADK